MIPDFITVFLYNFKIQSPVLIHTCHPNHDIELSNVNCYLPLPNKCTETETVSMIVQWVSSMIPVMLSLHACPFAIYLMACRMKCNSACKLHHMQTITVLYKGHMATLSTANRTAISSDTFWAICLTMLMKEFKQIFAFEGGGVTFGLLASTVHHTNSPLIIIMSTLIWEWGCEVRWNLEIWEGVRGGGSNENL